MCSSCNAKRAHVTTVHLVERVLPRVPYRQWTLSFPHRLRWVLLKEAQLLADVLALFLRGFRIAAKVTWSDCRERCVTGRYACRGN